MQWCRTICKPIPTLTCDSRSYPLSTHTCQISSGSVYCVALEKPKNFFRHFHLQHSMTARPPPSGAETKLNAMHIYTVSQKNVQPLACYNFDTHEWILIFFGRNVTDKVRRFTMPPQITCASALPGKTRKSENHISLNWIVLHTQCTCALSSWKKKLSSVMCLIASNICWDSKISH